MKKYRIIILLPILVGLAAAFSIVSYILAAYHTEAAIGRPSSTSAIVLIYIPIVACVLGILGASAGLILGIILRYIFKITTVSLKTILILISSAVIAVALSDIYGHYEVKSSVNRNRPHVVYSDGTILKQRVSTEPAVKKEPTHVEYNFRGKSLEWNHREIFINFSSNDITVSDLAGNTIITTSLKGYSYIFDIQVMELHLAPNEESYLAIFARLRVTSRHGIFLIYSPEGKLVYQEILELVRWRMYSSSMPNSNLEALVIESEDHYKYYYDDAIHNKGKRHPKVPY